MKYIEEMESGSIFAIGDKKYLISSDFRVRNSTKQKMAINIGTGLVQWFDENTMVENVDLYYRDQDGNILSLTPS